MYLSVGRHRIGFGTLGALCGLLIAGLLIPLNLYLTHMLVRTLPPVLGVACLLYLGATRGSQADQRMTLSRETTRVLPGIVFLGTTGLIFFSILSSGRGLLFYAVTVVLSLLILIQIAFAAERDLAVGLLLTQVLAVGFVMRFAGIFGSAGYVGVDVWVHMSQYVEGILATESIEGMGETKYTAAPLYHLAVVSTAILTGLSARLALFGSMGVGMGLSGLFVYLAATRFVDPRWAVFAAAVYSISDFVVVWSIHLIPTSLGVVLFLALLILFIRIQQHGTHPSMIVLMVVLVVAMALTHQVASFIMLVLFGAGSIAQVTLNADQFRHRLFSGEKPLIRIHSVHGYSAFVLGLLMLVWSQTPWGDRSFTEAVVEILWGSIEGSAGLFDRSDATSVPGDETGTVLVEIIIPLLEYTGFLALLFGTVIGSLYLLQRERTSQEGFALIIAAVIMMVFTLVPPLFGLRNFLPGRWFAFLYAVMAILAAVGFDRLRRDCSPQLFMGIILVFAFVFSGGMVLASDATQDSPVFEEENVRYSYTPTEMTAMETIVETTESDANTPIYSDHPYTTVLNRYGEDDRFAAATVDEDSPDHETVIYRVYQHEEAPRFDTSEGDDHIRQTDIDEMCGTRSMGYDNGDVTLCER